MKKVKEIIIIILTSSVFVLGIFFSCFGFIEVISNLLKENYVVYINQNNSEYIHKYTGKESNIKKVEYSNARSKATVYYSDGTTESINKDSSALYSYIKNNGIAKARIWTIIMGISIVVVGVTYIYFYKEM